MIEDALRRRILDLGLENDIPLWEVADDCRAAGLIAADRRGIDVPGEALLALARTGRIRVRAGPWADPTTRDANVEEAELFLLDPRRYSSAEEIANGLDRVYYVNVDNIVE